VSAAAASGNGTEKAAEPVGDTTQKVIEEAALPAATVEAIREEAAHVAEDATHIPEQQSYDGAGFYAQEEEIETPALTPTSASTPTLDSTPAPASTPSMDDLVAKVLAQMNPEMLQAVTREILKPVVEAMVKEELKSKKP
jgi:hypothetical protein